MQTFLKWKWPADFFVWKMYAYIMDSIISWGQKIDTYFVNMKDSNWDKLH